MNKVLITGLGVAKELGICEICNLNFSWLVNNPSTILWADQLYIPRVSYDAQIANQESKSDKVIGMFLEMAEEHGIIKKLNLTDMYQEAVGDKIHQKMLADSQALLKTFPEIIRKGDKEVPNEILIGDEGYCGAWMSSIYAGIKVAKDIDARKRLEPQIRELVAANLPNVVSYSRSIPLGPPAAYPVMLRVTGPDDNIVKEYAQKVRTVMAQNPAVTMTRFDWMEQNGAAKLTIDNDKLRQMGLSRKEVATALQAEISGYTVAQYLEGDQAIDMVFRLQPVDRSTVTELETLTIPTSAGAVPLSQVARLSYESENGMIWRRNLLPTITVCGGIGEGVTGNDITQQVYDDLAELRQNLPNGVTIEIGGSLEDSAKTLGYLLEPVPVMLLLMMILLMLQLKDIRKLFIILCTAPLGVTGVMLGLIIFNAPLGFMAELGILALTGIIIRNSVVLIDQIDLHLQAGKSPWESVLESAIVRFRPIMLAALTTILGLIPMFTSPFWNSMAVAIACGLSAATLLTLIVLPVIYAAVFKIKPE